MDKLVRPFLLRYQTPYVSALLNMIYWVTFPCILLCNILHLGTKSNLHQSSTLLPVFYSFMAGVDFKTTSNADSLCCSGIRNSNACTKGFMSVKPSYLGGSHNSVPIQRNDLVMRAHHLVDTSCILRCQCSKPSSESDAHELMLL